LWLDVRVYECKAYGLAAYDVAFKRLPFLKMSPLLSYFKTPNLRTDEDRSCKSRHANTNTYEPQSLAELELPFTREELVNYAEHRKAGLAQQHKKMKQPSVSGDDCAQSFSVEFKVVAP